MEWTKIGIRLESLGLPLRKALQEATKMCSDHGSLNFTEVRT